MEKLNKKLSLEHSMKLRALVTNFAQKKNIFIDKDKDKDKKVESNDFNGNSSMEKTEIETSQVGVNEKPIDKKDELKPKPKVNVTKLNVCKINEIFIDSGWSPKEPNKEANNLEISEQTEIIIDSGWIEEPRSGRSIKVEAEVSSSWETTLPLPSGFGKIDQTEIPNKVQSQQGKFPPSSLILTPGKVNQMKEANKTPNPKSPTLYSSSASSFGKISKETMESPKIPAFEIIEVVTLSSSSSSSSSSSESMDSSHKVNLQEFPNKPPKAKPTLYSSSLISSSLFTPSLNGPKIPSPKVPNLEFPNTFNSEKFASNSALSFEALRKLSQMEHSKKFETGNQVENPTKVKPANPAPSCPSLMSSGKIMENGMECKSQIEISSPSTSSSMSSGNVTETGEKSKVPTANPIWISSALMHPSGNVIKMGDSTKSSKNSASSASSSPSFTASSSVSSGKINRLEIPNLVKTPQSFQQSEGKNHGANSKKREGTSEHAWTQVKKGRMENPEKRPSMLDAERPLSYKARKFLKSELLKSLDTTTTTLTDFKNTMRILLESVSLQQLNSHTIPKPIKNTNDSLIFANIEDFMKNCGNRLISSGGTFKLACVCEKIFSSELALKNHGFEKHVPISERVFRCPFCNVQTNVMARVRSHIFVGKVHNKVNSEWSSDIGEFVYSIVKEREDAPYKMVNFEQFIQRPWRQVLYIAEDLEFFLNAVLFFRAFLKEQEKLPKAQRIEITIDTCKTLLKSVLGFDDLPKEANLKKRMKRYAKELFEMFQGNDDVDRIGKEWENFQIPEKWAAGRKSSTI